MEVKKNGVRHNPKGESKLSASSMWKARKISSEWHSQSDIYRVLFSVHRPYVGPETTVFQEILYTEELVRLQQLKENKLLQRNPVQLPTLVLGNSQPPTTPALRLSEVFEHSHTHTLRLELAQIKHRKMAP